MNQGFEYVQEGEKLCQKQQLRAAERAFQRAIRTYQKEKDTPGVAFALGRLGDCYEQNGEKDRAVETYLRAVELETDIPTIYSGLISILVDQRQLDRAFKVADQWQMHGERHISGPAHNIFVNIGARLVREKRCEEAVALLSRAVRAIGIQDYPDQHWAAIGQLGYAYEKAGDMGTAADIFAAAIKDGSNDRRTYTRYIMYLEKTKEYDQALRTIEQGLKIQASAAWEADLRKRQQRIERKTGKVPKDAEPKVIPAFSVRKGKRSVSLVHQVKFSPQLAHLAVGQQVAYATSGGKKPKLSAWQLEDAHLLWQNELPEVAHGVMATGETIVTYAQEGRVGDGKTILRFFDLAGNETAVCSLPDAPSQVVADSGYVYAGCRDGRLYAFSRQGRSLWSYRVPGSRESQDSPYMRPCPYYISAAAGLVVFSSFGDVLALNTRGKLRWRWSVPKRQSVSRSGNITVTMSFGPTLVRGLCVAKGGSRVVLTTDDVVYELTNGKTSSKVSRKGKVLSSVTLGPSGRLWVIGADDQVLILKEGKAAGRFNIAQSAELSLNHEADRVIAWKGKQLTIATMAGKVIADIEFVRNIPHVQCLDDGRVVVGAGHLIVLGTSPQPSGSRTVSGEQPAKAGTAREHKAPDPAVDRPAEEYGIPIRWIEGKRLDTERGKALYQGKEGKALTIEQFALEHYMQVGYIGGWTENEYWWAIMSLLFWDVIFAKLPGVFMPQFGEFPGPMQDMPTDFFTPDFYSRRNTLIAKRMEELTQPRLFGLRKPSIEAELRSSFRRHRGKPCRSMDWKRFPKVESLAVATRSLTDQQLLRIMHRLLQSFSQNRSGLPDLYLVHSDTPLFSEVKAEREKVAEHQVQWMQYLKGQVGTAVEICRVISLG